MSSTVSVILGHGASGTAASMAPWVKGLGGHGIEARAIDLPKGKAERAVPVFRQAIEGSAGLVVPGGHSFGGRVSSLAVAELLANAPVSGAPLSGAERVAGLLLLSYPLHRPGGFDTWRDRTAHWPALRVPVLLLSGESDPFARLDLLRAAVTLLPNGRLITYARVGHGLTPVLDAAVREAARFIESLPR